jgi:hypothetical protein
MVGIGLHSRRLSLSPAQGGRQTATYVDARRGDGRDVDRAACIAALKQP